MRGLIAWIALALAACAPAQSTQKAAPALNQESLPTEPEPLLKIADEHFERGGQGVQNSLMALDRALAKNPGWAESKDAFAAHFRRARAYVELAYGDDNTRKGEMSKAGMAAARRAIELSPERVEGYYYLAQAVGYAIQAKGENKEMIQEMVRLGERAFQIDETFDHGGPSRFLGAVHARAPAPPLSIGDPEKAVHYLRRAVQLAPAFPGNTLYLADALVADERYQEAESALRALKEMIADPRWARYRPMWEDEMRKIERKLRAKQG